MRHRYISLLLAIALSGEVCHSAVRDSLGVSERLGERDAYVDALFGRVSNITPVSYIDRYAGPLTVLSAAFSESRSSVEPVLLPSDARIVGVGGAMTYLPIKESRLWGRLDYDDGRYDKVGSGISADAGLVWPYVMADTTVKRIHHSCLRVGAGYARDLDNWAVGIDLYCAATHESRKSEVGPSNFSCDMKAVFGMSYLLPRYRLGVSVGGRKYSQDNDLSVRAGSEVEVYHLLGLWTDMASLRGSSESVSYSGKGFSVGLHLTPRRTATWYASAFFSRLTMDKEVELPEGSAKLSSCLQRALIFALGRAFGEGARLS